MQATGGRLPHRYGLRQERAARCRRLSVAYRRACAGFVREDDRHRSKDRIRHAGTARPRTVCTALGNPGQVTFQQTCLTPTSCRRCHFGMLRIEVEANSQLAELAIHMRWVAAGPVLSLRGRCVCQYGFFRSSRQSTLLPNEHTCVVISGEKRMRIRVFA